MTNRKGGFSVFRIYIGVILLLTVLLLSGCNSNKEDSMQQPDKKNEVESKDVTNSTDSTNTDKVAINHDKYPMPILEGWKEIEIAFKTMGDGRIELWTGEFSFEGPISDYFEPYQDALTDAGFEVGVSDDTKNLQTLAFTQTIDGKDYIGNTTFSQRWVKSGLQHFM